MSNNKRRKIATTEPQVLSAIARRKLQAIGSTESKYEAVNISKQTSTTSTDEDVLDGSVLDALSQSSARDIRTGAVIQSAESTLHKDLGDIPYLSEAEAELADIPSSLESRESTQHNLNRGSNSLTTLKPDKSNVKRIKNDCLRIKISAGERIVILGQYGLSVLKGRVTLLGARLSPSETTHWVYALPSHSLPVIRCSSSNCDEAEIQLHQYRSGLLDLGDLSPVFQGLGVNDGRDLLGIPYPEGTIKRKSTFQLLFSEPELTYRTLPWPIIAPPEWNETLATTLTKRQQRTTSVMLLCGPKSSGKSTFAILLSNLFLTEPQRSRQVHPGIAFLDLDPGQSEFSVPGQIALSHLRAPSFGPPFSHSLPHLQNSVVRSHSIGAITPAADPSLYLSCVADLLSRFKDLCKNHYGCSLIINTPGWIQGTGLELLVDLINVSQPTEVIYMSKEGPLDVVSTLKQVAKDIPFITLPSQSKDYMTRTALHLRTMQMMSYFHSNHWDQALPKWDSRPLTSVPPFQVPFFGSQKGILGVLCLGEQPLPEMLNNTINGSLVAVVVIENISAIRSGTDEDRGAQNVEVAEKKGYISSGRTAAVGLTPQESSLSNDFLILTPEGIPYFSPAKEISLDPRTSRSLGLGLIRSIDTERKMLQILTPIPIDILRSATDTGQSIVLVSGKLDVPGWAYTEELYRRTTAAKREKRRAIIMTESSDSEPEHALGDVVMAESTELGDFSDVPWIEKLSGDQGRGVMNRVWRVRRDLGKSAG